VKAKALLLAAIIFAAVFAMFGSAAAQKTMQMVLAYPSDNSINARTCYHITFASPTGIQKGSTLTIYFNATADPSDAVVVLTENCKAVLAGTSSTSVTLLMAEEIPAETIATIVLCNITNSQNPGTYNIALQGTGKDGNPVWGESQPFELSGPSYTATALGTIVGNVVHMADVLIDAVAASSVPTDLAEIIETVVDIVEDLVKALP